jgi:hypothetical protein
MESIEIITLQRARDFSRRMNATFEFIKQNFRSLSSSILIIAGPAVLLSSALLASMMNDFFSVFTGAIANPEVVNTYFLSVSFWVQFILIMLLFFVSSIITISTINNYIILYDEKKTNHIRVSDVWERVRGSFWMYVGTMLLFGVLFFAFYLALIFVSVFFTLISQIFLFLGILAFYGAVIYLMVCSSLTFFIRSYERKGFFEALSRSFKLIRGKWWSTFGFAFVISFIMYSIAGIFFLPFYIFFIVQMLHNTSSLDGPQFTAAMQWSVIVFMTVYYLISIILNMLPNIAIAFQYFNLVEIKEARGLISQFESIGQENDTMSADEQY